MTHDFTHVLTLTVTERLDITTRVQSVVHSLTTWPPNVHACCFTVRLALWSRHDVVMIQGSYKHLQIQHMSYIHIRTSLLTSSMWHMPMIRGTPTIGR